MLRNDPPPPTPRAALLLSVALWAKVLENAVPARYRHTLRATPRAPANSGTARRCVIIFARAHAHRACESGNDQDPHAAATGKRAGDFALNLYLFAQRARH